MDRTVPAGAAFLLLRRTSMLDLSAEKTDRATASGPRLIAWPKGLPFGEVSLLPACHSWPQNPDRGQVWYGGATPDTRGLHRS